jgi:Mg2+ and Co2+ transporter CorA
MSIQQDRKEPLLNDGQGSEDYTSVDDSGTLRKAESLVRRKKMWVRKTVWSPEDLRRLFRTLDNNGNGRLTYDEFRSGLTELGFESKEDSAKALYKSMDKDGDGSIRESEFLKLFKNMNRDFLQKQLTTQVDKAVGLKNKKVNVKIVDFGFDDGKGQFQELDFNETNLTALIKVKPLAWKKRIRWIDIHGDAPEVIQLLANDLDVPDFIVDEAGLKLSGKVQFFPEHQILEVVTFRVALEHLPLRGLTDAEIKKQKSKRSFEEEEHEREHTHTLKLGKAYQSPELRSSQVLFLCFGDHTVLTVRRRSHLSEIANVFNDVPADIKQFTSEVKGPMEITSTQEFLCSLLNEVNEQNWVLKDNFKEWKVTLEKAMHENIVAGQSRHILDLDRTASAALGLLEPFVKSSTKVLALEAPAEGKEESKVEKKEKEDESSVKVLQFLSKEKQLYRDTTTSAQKLVESLKFTRTQCAQLNEFFKHQSDERQNDTLKILTVLTSSIIPMQLSTGVFGMNFEHMPELPYEYSYTIFWILNAFVLVLILSFWRSRGFI